VDSPIEKWAKVLNRSSINDNVEVISIWKYTQVVTKKCKLKQYHYKIKPHCNALSLTKLTRVKKTKKKMVR
jgi:hypothetical protein